MPFPWLAAAAFGGSLLDAYSGQSAAQRANRTNVKLQREQQKWEESMSNSAVQRRADDIEKAGGNRALAFTTGSEASTPTISPAKVEPAPFKANLGSAALTAAQLKNLNASTALTTAKAGQEQEMLDYMKRPGVRGQNRFQSRMDIEDLHRRLKYDTDAIRKDMTAAQLKQFENATDAVVATIKNQAERGKIELEQIKSVIEGFGLGAQQKATLIKSIMQLIVPLFGGKD